MIVVRTIFQKVIVARMPIVLSISTKAKAMHINNQQKN
jgi:hypothetical protein